MQKNKADKAAPVAEEKEAIKKFGVFNKDGFPTAFYSSDVHKDIPKDALAISDDQWEEFIQNPNERLFKDGQVIEGTPAPEPVTIEKIRKKRNVLLAKSDWTQLADAPLSDEEKSTWASYRQKLRDLPKSGDAEKIKFPSEPA